MNIIPSKFAQKKPFHQVYARQRVWSGGQKVMKSDELESDEKWWKVMKSDEKWWKVMKVMKVMNIIHSKWA